MEKIYLVVHESETEYKTKFKPERMYGNWIFPENEEIKQILISMGVEWLQGYHTGKPVPIESLWS